jgi:predicted site-specific integrase-resolvase
MYVTPNKAAKFYSVSENALRVWANEGRIKFITTKGGHRRYFLPDDHSPTTSHPPQERQNFIYARVSSRKQKNDLERQISFLQDKYPSFLVLSDIGSGLNSERTGFRKILEGVFKGTINQVVVAHRDRFSRFGYSLFEWIFQQHGSSLICDSTEEPSHQEELSEDLMAILTVYTAKYYGSRKYKRSIHQEGKILS